MRMKRLLALLLACAAIRGMLVLPSTAGAATTTAFTRHLRHKCSPGRRDPAPAGYCQRYRRHRFPQPDRALTRAEFCKLAVELMGNGDKVAAQMNRTVFQDVPSTHWARGYIAVATQGTTTGSGDTAVTTPGIHPG